MEFAPVPRAPIDSPPSSPLTELLAGIWRSATPIPLLEGEQAWLGALGLSIELRGGRPPCPALGEEGLLCFSHPLPGSGGDVCWWLLAGGHHFYRRPGAGALLFLSSPPDPSRRRRAVVWPEEHLTRGDVGDLVTRQACALFLPRRGLTLLHASSVVVDGGAVIFLGPSGTGKSTLAGAFVSKGYPLLGDELTPIGKQDDWFSASPGCPLLDIAPCMARELGLGGTATEAGGGDDFKVRIEFAWRSPLHASAEAPLRALYHLAPSQSAPGASGPCLQVLRPREGFLALLRNSYKMVWQDWEILRSHQLMLADLANTVGVRRVSPHYRRSSPLDLRETILEDLAASARRGAPEPLRGHPA